ncbi:toxin-antitoxin system HicB family antitoxin [Paralcaligenes ureilyticus]|uniref:Putative HicB family RNase H-like nuclease n=1 Tax=Paralcaligenes ureilyticus TaxID=627131 RepID=A0A4R3M8R3_9BURK|nr:toxin-antitoxin system HicB family antitoxin [Paralcaligenes ureilyticus]TCT09492.1 putative HicB family RNase H-like nuclease [Paralcaligenes ureilyticus]
MSNFDSGAYTISVKRVSQDGELCFHAAVAEIPDISSYAETSTEAYEEVIEALEILHETAESQGKEFPAPFASIGPAPYSGRVTLRMSKSIHAEVARCAEEDAVSLNQWIIEAISLRRGFYIGVAAAAPKYMNLITSLFPMIQQVATTVNEMHLIKNELFLTSSIQKEPIYRQLPFVPLVN